MSDYDGTAVEPKGFCPHCSGSSFVYHPGRCLEVKAKEYYQSGGLKRIEFVDTDKFQASRITSSMKQSREVVIEELTLLKPGKYTIVLGELRRIIDSVPPGLT